MRKILFSTIFMATVLLFTHQSFSAPVWEIKDFKGKVGNIKIHVNGQPVATRMEPFIMVNNSLTMVPLRDLSEALGFTVQWDDKTRAINITGKAAPIVKDQSWSSKPKEKLANIPVIRNVGPFYQKKATGFNIAGRSFNSGVAVKIDNTNNNAEVVLDLNQKYTTMEGSFGVDDETMNSSGGYRLIVLGDGRELFTSDIIKPSEYPRTFEAGEINLEYVNRLTFRVQWERVGIGNFDHIVAALGNFNFYLKERVASVSLSTYQEDKHLRGTATKVITVQPGDTLFRIAQNNNTTVEKLLILNPGLTPDIIKVGQLIIVRQGDRDLSGDFLETRETRGTVP
jgi:hypothetical protein